MGMGQRCRSKGACLYASDALSRALQPPAQLLLLLIGLLYEFVGVLHGLIHVKPPLQHSADITGVVRLRIHAQIQDRALAIPHFQCSALQGRGREHCMTGQGSIA